MANTKFTQGRTEKIVESRKEEKFKEIFQILDSDGDGLISAQWIDISVMSPEILQIFTPLFCEMEEMNQTLDLEEFVDASKRLYETLTVFDKDMVLAFS